MSKNLFKKRGGIVPCLLSAVTLFFASGCSQKKQKKSSQEKEILSFRNKLKNYNFKSDTPSVLSSLDNFAHRSKGDTAVQAFYYSGRGYLDWFLTALIRKDKALLSSLFKALDLPLKCVNSSKIRNGGISVGKDCKEKLKKALTSRFSAMAKKEGSCGAYVDLWRESKSLVTWLVEGNLSKIPKVAEEIYKLLATRDPMGTRTRLSLLIRLGKTLEEIQKRDSSTASYVLARLLPFPCMDVFPELLGKTSAKGVQTLLNDSECGYGCPFLQPTKTPQDFSKTAIQKCNFSPLGYQRPRETVYHTVQTSVAVRSLDALSRVSKGIPEELSDPIIKLHLALVRSRLKEISSLRFPVPLPSTVKTSKGWVSPPILSPPGEPSQPKAPVVAIVEKNSLSLFTRPLVGFQDKKPKILNETKGLPLPGKPFSNTPTDKINLIKSLKKARTLMTSLLPAQAKAERSLWITLYMEGKEPLRTLSSRLSFLQKQNVLGTEMLYLPTQNPLSIPVTFRIHLKPPPKKAMSTKDILEKLKKKKEISQKSPFVTVSPNVDEPMKNTLAQWITIKKLLPKSSFYWKLK